MAIETDLVGKIIFLLSTISFIIVSIFLIRINNLRKQHQTMKIVTTTSGTIMLAMFFINAVISFSYLRYVFDPISSINEQSMYALAYMIYFALWVFANNYFLANIARIPPNRVRRFNLVKKILNLEIFLTGVLAIYSSGTIPFLVKGDNFEDFVGYSFVALSQIALVTFLFFYRTLGVEQQKNASKLVKARLQLMRYSIIIQIIFSLAIGIGATLIVIDLTESVYLEFFIFFVMNIVSIITSFIVYHSVDIPNRVRIKYSIAPSRFKYILSDNR